MNNFAVKLKYELVDQSGPAHSPTFTVVAKMDDKTFTGVGNSKKMAKHKAAQEALRVLMEDDKTSKKYVVNDLTESKIKKSLGKMFKKGKCMVNPISALNDMSVGARYEVLEQEGPAHAPIFKVVAIVDNNKYTGVGMTKKQAKMKSAEEALRSMHEAACLNNNNESDSETSSTCGDGSLTCGSETDASDEQSNGGGRTVPNAHPVSVLHEIRSGLVFKVEEETGPLHKPEFRISVEVDGEKFYGVGGTKKLAKCNAAQSALTSLMRYSDDQKLIAARLSNDGSKKKEINRLLSKKGVLKHPLMLVNELFPNSEFDVTFKALDEFSRFKAVLTLNDDTFVATGK